MKLLIVEDTKKNREDAIRIIEGLANEQSIDLQIITANDASEGRERIREGVDGVITDVYMPLSSSGPWDHADSPCGINVAAVAMECKIPCLFCTSGGHHGAKLEWLHSLIGSGVLGLPLMVDGGKGGSLALDYYNGEADEKNWGEAFEKLYRMITGIYLIKKVGKCKGSEGWGGGHSEAD